MLIILDRDGVINEDLIGDYVCHVEQWRAVPGSIEAIAQLTRAGHQIAVATNQAGLAKGLFGLDELETIHAHMLERVEAAGGQIDGVFYCPHQATDHCNCRKPAPGLLLAINRELGCEVKDAVLVGDKLSDLQLAEAGGCRPVLVRTGYGRETEQKLSELHNPAAVKVYDNLAEAVNALLQGSAR
jgi:D-glycero-D-manno-heptose 1,7-bisphosphate phosphatase